MNPSEAEIRRAIEGLRGRWGAFEMLVGRWAQIYYGERFEKLKIQGRKNEVAMPRWPDALSERADGSWDCLEATLSADWPGHLANDLKRIEEHQASGKSIVGFVLVAWAPDPDRNKRKKARERIVAKGVPAEMVDLVFEGELSDSLTQGGFAHLWRESLGLPFDARPFRRVGAGKALSEIDAGGGPFRPRAEEFREKLVHQPALLGAVLERLQSAGVAEVRGHGAAGKTVLAEHVLHRHLTRDAPKVVDGEIDAAERLSARPAYYIKLGSFERRSDNTQGLTEALARKADEGVLFVIDDIHLDPQGALDLKDAWESIGSKGQLLLLGREQGKDFGSTGGSRASATEDLALQLVVEGDDLRGIYRRLARAQQNETEPPVPPEEAVSEWLELFGGDLVLFSMALSARLPRMLREENWGLDAADAAELVKERYLRGLSPDERSELLNIALLAESEIGIPLGLTKSGLEKSRKRALVVNTSWGAGDPGEARLVHPGFGGLLMAASEDQPERDDLFAWAERDTAFAIRLGLHFKECGEISAATQAWSLALLEMPGLARALGALPEDTAGAVLDGLDELGLSEEGKLDRNLAREVEPILATVLDRTAQLPGVLRTSAERLPQTRVAIVTELGDPARADALLSELGRLDPGLATQRLRSWLAAEPRLAEILARRLEDPQRLARFLERSEDLAILLGSSAVEVLCSAMKDRREAFRGVIEAQPATRKALATRILAGRLDDVPRAIRHATELSETLGEELRIQLQDPEVRRRFADFATSLAPAQLIGLIRFAAETDAELLSVIEGAIDRSTRDRIVERLQEEDLALRGFENLGDSSDLAQAVVEEIRGPDWTPKQQPRRRHGRRGKRAEGPIVRVLRDDPSEAINLDLGGLIVFLASAKQDGVNGKLGEEVGEILRSPGNLERVQRLAEQLRPGPLHQSLVWAQREAPELCEAILARLGRKSVRDRCLRDWVLRGSFDSIAGLLNFLEEREPALAAAVRDELQDPRLSGPLLEAGFRSSPGGWAAFLKRDELAASILPGVDRRRWQRYWSRQPAETPHWLATLNRALFRHDRVDLQSAPAENVLLNSGPAHWTSRSISLAQLSSVLYHGRDLGEDAVVVFLRRVGMEGLLEEQYAGRASSWSIARLLLTASSHYGTPVLDLVLDDSLARRVQRDMQIDWGERDSRENGGVLAMSGALHWAGAPAFLVLPGESHVLAALASISGSRLNANHVLAWVGLRSAVSELDRGLRLSKADVPSRHLALFREATPTDPQAETVNIWMIGWLEEAERNGWTLAPDPGGTKLPVST